MISAVDVGGGQGGDVGSRAKGRCGVCESIEGGTREVQEEMC